MRRHACCLLALPRLPRALDDATFRGDLRNRAGTCADGARMWHALALAFADHDARPT